MEIRPLLITRLRRIGQDYSMLAVEFRTWLIQDLHQDLHINIPVMGTTGLDSIASLCVVASRQRLPDVQDETKHETHLETGSLDPIQTVCRSPAAHSRFTHMPIASHDDVSATFMDLARRNWRLVEGSTFEPVLLTCTPDHHTLVVGWHHIIMDVMSWNVFLTDLNNVYMMRPLASCAVSYLDFLQEQNRVIQSGEMEGAIQYYLQEMQSIPEAIPLLPIATSPPASP
ncbi:hypothetical protein AN6962.2 [Aspergillus nidulans FGSC A4]|uniref:Condensation domain-containing protein n=1 Tax=Emericella nidulans (strain FGSC A4 / ATCC 38163 / CBS 112.46 / NRRL 194 / M139) TaxID=227321 RepID=Q5AXL8_EMENI|nr:hypothetical protein [Aspergillus nidulans FGSC A4]EAA57604.1 hypothetical protein AN6962.2 [Aspergillus nidulans FGSC A4]CBF71841.1 TPA: conserved hypothetical protein [Aspergillus nidulans FGSC A4]|eukprot:XP_664566.1 hypothetical protein AN6962.2 [Aspergillus nidulans FGSC A4]